MRALLLFFGYCVFMIALMLVSLTESEARGNDAPYVPEIIEVEQPHAWCYVLKNRQNSLVGNIHTLSCVPKGNTDRKLDVLSLEESESD